MQRAAAVVLSALVVAAVLAVHAAGAAAQPSMLDSRVNKLLEHTPEVVGPNHYRYTTTHTYGLGRVVSLTYDMLYGDFVQVLTTQQASAVVCSAPTAPQQTLTVTYAVGVTPTLAVNDVAVGAASWGCVSQYGAYAAPFYRRVVSIVSQSAGSATAGAVVTYAVSVASWVDLCEECTLQHRVNDLPSTTQQVAPLVDFSDYVDVINDAAAGTSRSADAAGKLIVANGRRGFFHHVAHVFHTVVHTIVNVVHDVIHIVHDLPHVVVNVVKKVINTIEDAIKILEGNIDIDKNILSFSANWNLDAGTGRAIGVVPLYSKRLLNNVLDVEVGCTTCYLATDATLNFQLHIKHYSLQVIELTMSGSATGEAVLTAQTQLTWSDSATLRVATLNFPSINFMAGPIPVHISFTMPVDLQWSVSVSASLGVQMALHGNGQLHYGIAYGNYPSQWTQWQPSDGGFGWHHLSAHSMDFTASSSAAANVQVGTQVTIVPQLQVSIEGLGGPTFTVQPWVRGNVAAHANVGGANAGFTATVSVYGGLDVTVGATFHIPVIDHTWTFGPRQILDINRLLFSKTYGVRNGRPFGGRVPLAAGDAPRPVPVGMQNCSSVCTIASGLGVCSHLNGAAVCGDGTDFAAREQIVIETLRNYTASGMACVQLFAPVICNLQFAACADVSTTPGMALLNVCGSHCMSALSACGATAPVAELACTSLIVSPETTYVDDAAPCVGSVAAEPEQSSVYGSACGVASDLRVCTMMNGRRVAYNTLLFDSLADVDVFVGEKLAADGSASAAAVGASCASTSVNMMCAEYMPECATDGTVLSLCASSCTNQLQQCNMTADAAPLCSGPGVSAPFTYYVASETSGDGSSACGHSFLAGTVVPTVPAASVALGAGLGGGIAGAVIVVLAIALGLTCVRARRLAAAAGAATRRGELSEPSLLADASA